MDTFKIQILSDDGVVGIRDIAPTGNLTQVVLIDTMVDGDSIHAWSGTDPFGRVRRMYAISKLFLDGSCQGSVLGS